MIHLVAAVNAEKYPAGQLSHLDIPLSSDDPNHPRGHSSHDFWPFIFWKYPKGHFSQILAARFRLYFT